MRCWLEQNGVKRQIGAGGVLIGRLGDCDLVLEDSRVSRHHALVRVGPGGPELLQLGRNPSKVNGELAAGTVALKDGDEISLPGKVQLVVRIERAGRLRPMRWVVEREDGTRFGVTRFPFTVGGGAEDNLQLSEMPPHGIRLLRAQGSVFCQTLGAYNGQPSEDDEEMTPVFPGDTVSIADETFRLLLLSEDGQRVTVVPEATPEMTTLRLHFLPTGGRLVVSYTNSEQVSCYMPERRFALLATLLTPSGGLVAGDFVPDDVVCSGVWPRNRQKGREHVNVLLKRAREDLVKAGLNGFKLLERAQGGGATRFVLPSGVSITVDT